MSAPACALCAEPGGRVVVETPQWRLVHAGEAAFPGFYRLVWNAHVRELSQLSRAQRHACIDALAAVEDAMLRHLAPTKMNVATLGNAVPHLHWHLVARFDWDSHFPRPVWDAALREAPADRQAQLAARLPALENALAAAFHTSN